VRIKDQTCQKKTPVFARTTMQRLWGETYAQNVNVHDRQTIPVVAFVLAVNLEARIAVKVRSVQRMETSDSKVALGRLLKLVGSNMMLFDPQTSQRTQGDAITQPAEHTYTGANWGSMDSRRR
jgi:hypothetical protein